MQNSPIHAEIEEYKKEETLVSFTFLIFPCFWCAYMRIYA